MNITTHLHDEALLREDENARRDALDATRSFLVQAPAGSGKTELLIQRLLALLARVDEPERILALTFTRKAAGEMRERVVDALSAAARAEPLDPGQPHLAVTRELAHAVLAQDARRGWALALHPARLRIMTFDALTTWIVRNAPFAAGLGPAPGYAEDAHGLYAEAAAAARSSTPHPTTRIGPACSSTCTTTPTPFFGPDLVLRFDQHHLMRHPLQHGLNGIVGRQEPQ